MRARALWYSLFHFLQGIDCRGVAIHVAKKEERERLMKFAAEKNGSVCTLAPSGFCVFACAPVCV